MLVDEIDAHLHPDWQRRLLPELRKVFPGLQLLATTHSPLIVGNTKLGEVIHLEREDGTLRQQKLGIKFRGMRADQILTSEAFDLGTTRDSETDDMLTEYRRLMRKGDVSDISSARLAELRDQLRDTLPRPHETAISREAADLIGRMSHARIVEQLAEVPPERRSAVTREMQEYLQRLSDERGLS